MSNESISSVSLNPILPIELAQEKRMPLPCTEMTADLEEMRHSILAGARIKPRSSSRRLFNIATALLTSLLVVLLGIPGVLFQLLTTPLMAYDRQMVVRWHSYLAGLIWALLQHLFERQSGLRLTFSGLEGIPAHENAFLIANHSCFADFAVVHSIAIRKRMLSFCKYFVKDSVKYIPIFGWGMKLMGMVMLKRNWAEDRAKFTSFFTIFSGGRLPVYLVAYPEGSRTTPSKIARSQEHAKANGQPILKNLLLPRTKGFIATMTGLQGSDVSVLYDVTSVYYHRRRGLTASWSFKDMFTGRLDGYHVHVHVERIPFARLPSTDPELKAWLFARFEAKDHLVTQMSTILHEAYQQDKVQ